MPELVDLSPPPKKNSITDFYALGHIYLLHFLQIVTMIYLLKTQLLRTYLSWGSHEKETKKSLCAAKAMLLTPLSGSPQHYKVLNSKWCWDCKQSDSFHIPLTVLQSPLKSTASWLWYWLHMIKLHRTTHTDLSDIWISPGFNILLGFDFNVLVLICNNTRCCRREGWVKDA